MFVRSRRVWFGLTEKILCFARRNPENFHFLAKMTVILLYIFIYEQWLVITASREDLAAVVFVRTKFMSHFLCNLSCYCKINFPASVGLFGDNKSA